MANRIRELRQQKNLTMKQLGKIFGFSETTISLYENEKRQPTIETLIKMSDFFGVSVDYLINTESSTDSLPPKVSTIKEDLLTMFSVLSKEDQEELLNFAKFKVQQSTKEK